MSSREVHDNVRQRDPRALLCRRTSMCGSAEPGVGLLNGPRPAALDHFEPTQQRSSSVIGHVTVMSYDESARRPLPRNWRSRCSARQKMEILAFQRKNGMNALAVADRRCYMRCGGASACNMDVV